MLPVFIAIVLRKPRSQPSRAIDNNLFDEQKNKNRFRTALVQYNVTYIRGLEKFKSATCRRGFRGEFSVSGGVTRLGPGVTVIVFRHSSRFTFLKKFYRSRVLDPQRSDDILLPGVATAYLTP